MAMRAGLREKLRPILIESAQSICRNPLPDGSPCGDCRYTMGALGRNIIRVLTGEAEQVIRQRWCEEIISASMDG